MKKALALLLILMLALPVAALGETLTAEAPGFGGAVSVTLTVEDGKITAAEISGDSETPDVGGAALEPLADQLVTTGNADIDGVAGATFTSNAVKEAAAAALAQMGDAEATEAAALTDGEYTAEVVGFDRGLTDKVTVTIEGGKIVAVTYVDNETAEIGGVALPSLVQQAIDNNGVIDGVAGASMTSGAFRAAIADALSKAAM